ncbi:MAG: prepilin-type N-terminal cleavage/methylation domain-containing protein [Planctomycetota bacterium]|nr:prepilin-type N-terminal cleavage/methylation domain-containing protein [Planctomycetota bacterium]
MPRSRRAFTLLETILVIVLVGVVAAVGVPRLVESADRRQLLAEARRLAADLNLVRARAASTSMSYRIVFDIDRDQYSIMPQDGERAARVQEGLTSIDAAPSPTGAEVAIDLASTSRTGMLTATHGASLSRLDLGGADEIIFNGFGAPDRGGIVVLSRGKYSISITIEKDRGAVSIGAVTRTALDPIAADELPPADNDEADDITAPTTTDLELELLTGGDVIRLDTPIGSLQVGGTP